MKNRIKKKDIAAAYKFADKIGKKWIGDMLREKNPYSDLGMRHRVLVQTIGPLDKSYGLKIMELLLGAFCDGYVISAFQLGNEIKKTKGDLK